MIVNGVQNILNNGEYQGLNIGTNIEKHYKRKVENIVLNGEKNIQD
jgi:hypothetical protein